MSVLLAAKHAVADPLNRLGKQRGKRHLERENLLSLLGGRPADAFVPEYDDLWFLYKEAATRRPQVIWEFGSGYSTSILAEAAQRFEGRLYSIDAMREWADRTRALLPAHHTNTTVSFVPVVPVGDRFWRHESLPPELPNFIYLDGPPLTKERPIAIDVLEIEAQLPIGCFVVVDGRKMNTYYLRDHFRRGWSFSWDRIAQRGVFELRRG